MRTLALALLLGAAYASATKCQDQRKQAEAMAHKGIFGVFVPVCNADGSFQPFQCHKFGCFCVTPEGEQRPDSFRPPPEHDFVQRVCEGKATDCDKQREQAEKLIKMGMMGVRMPQCEADGRFHHTQCFEAMCSCVDQATGKAVEETAVPNYKFLDLEKKCGKKCMKERATSLASGMMGAYVPQCSEDGSYYHTQCHGSVCFCTDQETGETKKGTEGPIANKADIEKSCAGKSDNKREALSKCEQAQQDALQDLRPGKAIPRCTMDGDYYPMQCSESVCYCVNKDTGVKVAGSEGSVSEIADIDQRCNKEIGERVAGPCEREVMEHRAKPKLLGSFEPVCDSNGRYHPMQCKEAECFCVDRLTGGQIEGTQDSVAKRAEVEQKCAASNSLVSFAAVSRPSTECERQRKEVEAQEHRMGAFKPTCDDQGRFDVMQCQESVCYCADPVTGKKTGLEKHVSKSQELKDLCYNTMSRCQKERYDISGKHLIGGHMPACDDNGMYTKAQCHESVCFCVDELNGEAVPGTEANVGQFDAKSCDVTKCQKERDAAGSHGLGAFRPQCDRDHGNYVAVQCHEASCFCVDRTTGEKKGEPKEIAAIRELHKSCMTDCEQKRDIELTLQGRVGRHAPRCDVNGDYHNVQCQEAVCGCANAKTGEMNAASTKNIGHIQQLERQCPGGPKECSNLRVAYRWNMCTSNCTFYKGYGEALVYCCCD